MSSNLGSVLAVAAELNIIDVRLNYRKKCLMFGKIYVNFEIWNDRSTHQLVPYKSDY